MKTIAFLKRSFILQIIFCAICAVSLLLLYGGVHSGNNHLTNAGHVVTYFWLFNPVGLVCLIVGLVKAFREKKDPKARKVIGDKWIWFIVMFLVTCWVYLTAAALHVQITGGV